MFYWKKTDFSIVTCLTAVIGIFIFGCQNKPKDVVLFNVDSLVSEQVDFLSQHQATLHKNSIFNGAKDDTVFQADSATWQNELEIFRQLQTINKPVNRENYLIDDGLYDPASNLTVKAISTTANLPVKYVRVFYQDTLSKPRKIEALYDNKNALYSSSRLLTLEFGHFKNKLVLLSYTVAGGQQMKLGDSVMFKIKGEVILH